MKRLLPFLSFFLISGWSCADQLKTVFNPFTGKPDYITALTTNSIVAGSNVTTSCTNGACTINSSGGGGGGAGVIAGTGSLYQTPYVSVASSNTLQMSNDILQYPSTVTITVPLTVSTITYVSSITVQNITINGTCTGAGCGTSGSSTAINPSTSSILIPSPYTLTSMVSSSSPLVFVSSNIFTNVEGDPAITQCTQIGGTGLLSNSCNVNDPGPLATIANFVYMGYALASNHSSYGQYIDNNQNTSGGGNTFGAFNYAANGQVENIGVEGWGEMLQDLRLSTMGAIFLQWLPMAGLRLMEFILRNEAVH